MPAMADCCISVLDEGVIGKARTDRLCRLRSAPGRHYPNSMQDRQDRDDIAIFLPLLFSIVGLRVVISSVEILPRRRVGDAYPFDLSPDHRDSCRVAFVGPR